MSQSIINCDNRLCDNRRDVVLCAMDNDYLRKRLKSLDLKYKDVAEFLGIGPEKVSKVFTGVRQWRGDELVRLISWLEELESKGDILRPELPTADNGKTYLRVEILPSFAGMGGSGSGDGDIETGLVSRALIEDELRANPSDLLLIDVRGDSMVPDFHHGDQILIDRRDTSPRQPGPFALWDGEGYVIKLLEKIPNSDGLIKVFSANKRYSPYDVLAEELKIMGRPVWFARRL